MSFRFPQPSNEDDFELFCVRLLREMWRCPTLQQYGKRGERQHGIDLLDESGGPPMRAVQCKHHEPDKTIPPSEIQNEVGLALTSGLDLDEYYILTTARKTVHSQNALVRLNQEHTAKKQFKVILWTWADIEARLSELDDISQDRILRGDSGRSGPALVRMLTGVMAEHFDRPLYSTASALDLELDAIKDRIDRHELEVAEARLKDLEGRAADKLQPNQWYQLKALRSRVYSARWQWQQAGRELLDARRHAPTTDRARINEALGYELTGERDKAHQLATGLRAELTQSARLLSIWVRTAPPTASFQTVVEAAAPFAADDEELNLALAHRALLAELLTDAVRFATRATEIDADSPQAWFVLGQVHHALGFSRSTPVRAAHLHKACDCYDRAVELGHVQKLEGLEAAARINRGKARHVLGDKRSEADYLSAIELARPDEHLRTEYAGFLLDSGRPAEALRQLEAEAGEPSGARLLFEAVARYERNQAGDRILADSLVRQIISSDSSDRWTDAHILLTQWAVHGKQQDQVRPAVLTDKLRETDPLVYHTLAGWLTDSQGEREASTAAYLEAAQRVTSTSPRDYVFLLAQGLLSVGQDLTALPLLEQCYRPGMFDVECRKLLMCAQHLERHDISVRVCHDLRAAGEADPRIVQTELSVLQLYDPEAALVVARDYLSAHPGDRHVTLWQSTLAIRLDREDLVISDPDRLPTPDDLTARGGGMVVNILAETGQHSAALRYAHETLRIHFKEEFAHGQYMARFLQLSDHCPELGNSDLVALGTAVRFRTDAEGPGEWVVLEESEAADLSGGELEPAHPLSRALLGKKVGDHVTLSETDLQPRRLEVLEIAHKHVHRFRDCLSHYRIRFPEGTAIQAVDVGSGDDFNPSPIIKSLADRRKYIEQLDLTYRSNPMPFFMYAELAGRDEFAAWGHLVSQHNLGFRCYGGQVDGLERAVQATKECSTIVLDLTAIITLARLDLLRSLGATAATTVVSQSTYERLRHYADRAREDRRASGSLMLTDDGQLAHVETTTDERDRYQQFLEAICEAIREHCQVRPCPQAAGLEPKKRATYVDTIGRHNLETLLLAAAPDTLLWTDDLILGEVGRAEFHTTRIWTQAALGAFLERGELAQAAFDQAVAKLIGWQYLGIQLNERTLLAAADVAAWQTRQWPVRQVMQCLNNPAVDIHLRLRVAGFAIRAAWERGRSPDERRAFVLAVLDGVGGVQHVRVLLLAVPRLFEKRETGAREVWNIIANWLSAVSPRLAPRRRGHR